MPTATMPVTERPQPKLPSGVNKSDVWYDSDGQLRPHAIELPVDKKTHKINGRLFACVDPGCPTAEWAIEPDLEPKLKHCPRDGQLLLYVPLDPSQDDPIATGRQRQLAGLARLWASKQEKAAEKLRKSAMVRAVNETRTAAPQKLAQLAQDGQKHLPSLAAAVTVEIGVVYTVDLRGATAGLALAAMCTWGPLAGYWLAVQVEKLRLRLRKEGFEGRAAKKARERGLWAGKAIAGAGVFLTAVSALDGLVGLDAGSGPQWALLSLLGLALAWLVNKDHWDRLWADRRRLRQLAADNALRAAEADARRAEADALRALEEARLRDLLADAGAYDENNPKDCGERMRIEWERIGRLDSAPGNFPQIVKTKILPDRTREITAPDPRDGTMKRIGWEYLGVCEPGALIARGGMGSPLLAAKEWVVAVLFDGQFDAAAISLVDAPGGAQNTFLVMITERARLGDAVPWRAESAVRITDRGDVRYGYLGRALTGEDLDEVLYTRGQPFGGMVAGTTGGGKGGFATRYLLNCLKARIFPVLFDPKRLVDYGDFAGLFPIGFTKRHRRMLLEFLRLERERRQGVAAASPRTNKYGAKVAGESKWDTCDPTTGEIGAYGEPIGTVWDEFHDLSKDQGFLMDFTNHVRFQRVAGMGALLLSQGGGLEDWGNSTLRDLVNQTALTLFRTGDLNSRMAGGRNQTYSTADLPMLPGMCLRQAQGSLRVPMRAAFIGRDAQDEDTIFTTLWGKGSTPQLQVEDPLTWISHETIAIMKDTGVWDLWMQARNADRSFDPVGGLDRLLADTAEDEEDEEGVVIMTGARLPARQAAKTVVAQQPATGRMMARKVLMGILHEQPGINWDGVRTHDAWFRAPGWNGPPADATISRAAKDLDGGTDPMPEGVAQKIDRGPKSGSWRLTEAGAEDGARAAAQFAARQSTPVADGPDMPMPNPVGNGIPAVTIAEMAAQKAAEMAMIIAEETRGAWRG